MVALDAERSPSCRSGSRRQRLALTSGSIGALRATLRAAFCRARAMDQPVPLPPRPDEPLALLGGLTPAQFLRRHWQKKPLLIRAALSGFGALLSRAQLFGLAARRDVESRLVVRSGRRFRLAHGPLAKSALPPVGRRGWTLLVQGVDLHDAAVHALLQSFRFVPDARLDDLMISWASDGGGVGPHVDSYDVFLLQAQGRRRWRIGRERNPQFAANVPLKILERFVPDEEHVLGPGDMLYLPPHWAHDGIAEGGECMTYSIGFRAPRRAELAAEIAERLIEDYEDDAIYRDPRLAATAQPARIPPALQAFAAAAVARSIARPDGLARALGEALTEPKRGVSFAEPKGTWRSGAVALDRRTRMMYDARHVFINGDSYGAAGGDATLLRRLADERGLGAQAVGRAGRAAKRLLAEWFRAGWLHRRTR
jgi:50S ribosomal protein L16 3-hydroxylase